MKRLVMSLVSACVGIFDELRWVGCHLAGKEPAGVCIILYYHSVTGNQRCRFSRQMDILGQLALACRLEELFDVRSGERRVLVTFDDGFRSVRENAVPETIYRGIPLLVFVPSAQLGARPALVWHIAAAGYTLE
jgi:peptidoglycan/xylan/chitin deacetylase (PgdA/CDA1 family)